MGRPTGDMGLENSSEGVVGRLAGASVFDAFEVGVEVEGRRHRHGSLSEKVLLNADRTHYLVDKLGCSSIKRKGAGDAVARCGSLRTARSVERHMRIAREAELAAAEMGEILFGIERYVHRGEMDVTPSALNRMRRREAGRAAHADQRVDNIDARFRRA